jgi:hypothetical protein
MKQEVKIGQTDYTVLVLIRDTAGAPKTALTNASAGIDVCYTRVETDNDVVTTAGAVVALATPALADVHLDWGFLQVDATNAPGLYRLDIADGVFATGAWSAVVSLIATGIDPVHIEFILVPSSPYVGVQLDPTQAATTFASLSVTGQLDAGNVLVDSTVAVGTTTTLSGAVSLGSTLGVTGVTTLTGNVALADGITVAAPSTGNRAGVTITGNGTGQGIIVTGGGTSASGVAVVGGAPNGIAIYAQGDGSGEGLRVDGGDGSGAGVEINGGATNGSGVTITGDGTGHGLAITSGDGVTGNGVNVAAASTNGFGVSITGVGSGDGLIATGGLTGNGIKGLGGGTSGHGIQAKAAGTGHGISANGGGVAGDGINAIADNDGDGIDATGATNGHGMILTGIGTGEGFSATGGATGAGMLLTGGGNNANADGLRTVAGGALALDIDSAVLSAILLDTGTTLDTLIQDIPTVAEFNARSIVSADYTIVADLGVVQTADHTANIAAILADTGTDGVVVAAASKTGYAIGVGGIAATAFAANAIDAASLAADAVDEIHDEVVEGTTTSRQATRLVLSTLTGKSSGGGTATVIFRDIGDTKNRISATVDADGNRTSIGTRDGT